jgi:hypothetical protein
MITTKQTVRCVAKFLSSATIFSSVISATLEERALACFECGSQVAATMKSADFYYLFLVQVIAFVVFLIGFLPIPNKSGEYASLQSLPRDLNGFL